METTKWKALFAIPERYFLFTRDGYFLLNDINRIGAEEESSLWGKLRGKSSLVAGADAAWKLPCALGNIGETTFKTTLCNSNFPKVDITFRQCIFHAAKRKKKKNKTKMPEQENLCSVYPSIRQAQFATLWCIYSIVCMFRNERLFFSICSSLPETATPEKFCEYWKKLSYCRK